MKRILFATAAAIAVSSAAFAAADVSAMHANTARQATPEGDVDWFLNADGSFSASNGSSGTYSVNDTGVCFTFADETGEPAENCVTMEPLAPAVGETFTTTGGDGTSSQVTIVEGRAE